MKVTTFAPYNADMEFYLQTILTSLTSSVVVGGAVAYVLKRSFDRTLDLKIEQIKQQHKADVAEAVRRTAAIFDEQREVFKTVLSLAYRSRNCARSVLDGFVDDTAREGTKRDEAWNGFRTYSDSMIQLLYDERAIMPPKLFGVAHEMNNLLAGFALTAESLRRGLRRTNRTNDREFDETIAHLRDCYRKIDAMYSLVTQEVQARLGVAD